MKHLDLKTVGIYEVVFRRKESCDTSEKTISVIAESLVAAADLVRRANPQRWWYRTEVVAVKLTGTARSAA